MTGDIAELRASIRAAYSFDLADLRAEVRSYTQPQRPSILDIMFGRKFEQQLNRLERLLGRLGTTLNELSDVLGGGVDYTRPIRPWCGTHGGNGWESGWGGAQLSDPGQVIAGTGRIWGDPHFVGADGGKYDVQGEAGKIYNLLSDDGFQMNGRFDAWGGGGATVVGEVGINAKGDRIRVDGDGNVSVNGRELEDGERVRLAHGGYVRKDGDEITVKSGEWTVEFDAKTSSRGNYLNMDVSTNNAVADGIKPHGLLGQTFDGDGLARNGDKGRGAQGGGAIEAIWGSTADRGDKTTVENYEVRSLTDTTFNTFNRFTDIVGTVSFVENFDDFFTNGLYSGTNVNSDQILGAFNNAYGALSMSLMASSSLSGWGFYRFDIGNS